MTSATIAGLISYHPDLYIVAEWIQWQYVYLALLPTQFQSLHSFPVAGLSTCLLFATLVNFGILQWKRNTVIPGIFYSLLPSLYWKPVALAVVSIYDKIIIFQALCVDLVMQQNVN
jgi:hypothetical protein